MWPPQSLFAYLHARFGQPEVARGPAGVQALAVVLYGQRAHVRKEEVYVLRLGLAGASECLSAGQRRRRRVSTPRRVRRRARAARVGAGGVTLVRGSFRAYLRYSPSLGCDWKSRARRRGLQVGVKRSRGGKPNSAACIVRADG